MVAITHVSSFTWTVGMHNLTWHDAKRKSKTVGSIFLPEAMVTFWSHVEVPLITVCFYIFKVLVLQKCLRLPQVCGNRMMIRISHSFSRTFDMLVHFSPHKRRHPFQWFSPAIAWIFWGWSLRGVFGRELWKPNLHFLCYWLCQGLPDLVSLFSNPGRSARQPFMNTVYLKRSRWNM